jgi:hypothetical protein
VEVLSKCSIVVLAAGVPADGIIDAAANRLLALAVPENKKILPPESGVMPRFPAAAR